MIIINNLNKNYGKKKALDNVSFNIKKGDFFSLLGKNGAGKSTTIGILVSLIKKDSGKIKINNIDLDDDPSKIKALIGFVPQEYNFNQFERVSEIIINQAGYYGIKRHEAIKHTERLLKLFDLWNNKDTVSMQLSGGMKRRLMIARALIHNPDILILDEPTAGVDIISRRLIWNFLKNFNKNSKTIILTTHYLEEVESLCNNVAIINNGQIITEISVKDLLNNIEKKIFNLEIENLNNLLPYKSNDYEIKIINKNNIEIHSNPHIHLNSCLKEIMNNNILIKDIKSERNRLENLFINLINKDEI